MFTNNFYSHLATCLKNEGSTEASFSIAIGRGQTTWDRTLPVYDRGIEQLLDEVIRKPISPADINYLDESGRPSETAAPRLQIQMDFAAGEGEGTLRECGLFFNQENGPETGVLVSYFMHLRIEKGPGMSLQRSIQLDLTPHGNGSGQLIATRYLGNSNSQELHDLDNEQAGCQIAEIRFDRRFYFTNPQQASALNYDFCAYCFGRELSQR